MPLNESIVNKLKIKKNPTEIHGLEQAHIRDGAILCDFLAHFEEQVKIIYSGVAKGFSESGPIRKSSPILDLPLYRLSCALIKTTRDDTLPNEVGALFNPHPLLWSGSLIDSLVICSLKMEKNMMK